MTFRKILSLVIIMALLPLASYSQKDKKNTIKDTREYVDLGLPSKTLWATCNIGASKPEECGLYFAWGETEGYKQDSDDVHQWKKKSYKWYDCNSKYPELLKYRCCSWNAIIDNKEELDPEDDAATVNWGRKWQMPSSEQIKELCDSAYTTKEWTTLNGVNGRKITSKKNGHSIFLPAAGVLPGSRGDYWSCSLSRDDDSKAISLSFSENDYFHNDYIPRYYGLNIRPVRSQKNRKDAKPEITDYGATVMPIEDDQLIIIQSEPDEK